MKNILYIVLVALIVSLASAQSMGSISATWSEDLSALRSGYMEFLSTYGGELDQGSSDRKFLEEIISELTLSTQVEIKGDVLSSRFMNKERPAAPLKNSLSVCIVVSSFEGIYINSGIGTAYSALAEYLVSEGQKVTVLYTGPIKGNKDFGFWKNLYQEKGIELVQFAEEDYDVKISSSELATQSYKVYEHLSKESFDVVHFPEWEGIGYYSLLAKREGLSFQNTKMIVGLHGSTRWTLSAKNQVPTTVTELEADFMEQKSVELADMIWAPSEYYAHYTAEQGWKLPTDKFLMPFLMGSGLENLASLVKPKRRLNEVNEIVFFGRFEIRKGLDLFLDAIDLLADQTNAPDLKITFLGKSVAVHGQDANEYIQSRASAWPFTMKIINHYDRATALKYLSTHGRLAVMPSLIENTPYVAYEALVLNIPFIATDTETVRDLIHEEDQDEVLVQVNAESLARGLANAVTEGIIRARPAFTPANAKNSWRYFYNYVSTASAAVTSKVNRNPMVSVCIVHYNRPALLKQTLESVYAQDYSNIEVILVDDGSTDPAAIGYLQTLEGSFYSRGWKVIFSENQYLGAARNLAAKNAEGEFIYFLDDDNLIRKDTISTYVRVALQTGSNLLTAAHDVFPGLKKPTIKDITERWVPLGGSVAVGLFKNSFGDANFFVARNEFNEIGGFSEDRGVGLEDHEFHAKWVLSGRQMEVIPQPLLYYRMHDKQNQMIYTTDPLMNQFRYLRSYSDVFNNEAADMFRFINAKRTVSLACNETILTVSDTISELGGTISFTGSGFLCAQPYIVSFDGTSYTCSVNPGYTDTTFTCTSNWFDGPFPTLGETDITINFLNGDYIADSIEVVPAEAPVLVRAQFNTIGQIEAYFDEATDEADGRTGCDNYWDDATVKTFGTKAYCSFSDDETIIITLGAGATIVPGDSITLGHRHIRKLGETATGNAAHGSVVVDGPTDVPAVLTTISVSDVVSDCDTFVVRGTAYGYGRDLLAYEWKLVDDDDDPVVITSFIKGADLVFPANSLVEGGYTATLYAKNWYGDSSSDSVNFTVVNGVIPSISMDSVVKALRPRQIKITPEVTLPSCSATRSELTLTYSWTSSFVPQGVDTTQATLVLPAYSLDAGQTYTWTLTVSTSAGLSASLPVDIVVLAQDPSLSVADSITVGVGSDAELTVDYNYDDYPNSVPTFSWTCSSCGVAVFSDPTSEDTLLSDLAVGDYEVQVALTFSQYGTIYGFVTVHVVPGTPPKVIGLLFNIDDAFDYTPYIPVTSRTVVMPQGESAELNTVESWFWVVSPAVEGLDVNVRNLYVPKDSLTPFTRYTFTVYATRSGETAKVVGKRIAWALPLNGEISLRVGTETGFYQNQTYFVDFTNWVPAGADPSVLLYSVYIDGYPFVVDTSSNTVGPFSLLPGTHKIKGTVSFGPFFASKTFTLIITSDQCLRLPQDAFNYVILLRPIQPSEITSLSALAMGAPLVISCIEGSADGSAPEMQDARQQFLDYADQFMDELTPTEDNAKIGLELLVIALGTSERFGTPADLPLSAANMETIAKLFTKTVAAFQSAPSSVFSDPNTVNQMVNVASKAAQYILNFYLQLNNLGRSVQDEQVTIDEFLDAFNDFLDNIASSITIAEGSRFYEDSNVGLYIEKVAINKVTGGYRATRENAGATAYITRPVRTFLTGLDTFGEVGVVVVHWKQNLHGDDLTHEIVGGFVSVRFVIDNELIEIEDLSLPSVVSHYFNPGFGENQFPVCVYWNETSDSWEEEGVVVYNDEDDYVIECATTHFTDFAVATISVDCNGIIGGSLVVDECGVCGGDGTTCCSNYLGVDNKVWDFVLLPVAVRDMIERLENTRAVLEYVYDNIPEEDELYVEMQWGDVAEINNIFNDQCITPFCGLSKNFMGDLLDELRTEY